MSSETPLYDLLICPADAGHALPDGAVRAVLRQLATLQLAMPHDESVAKEWVEVYLAPGPMAHTIFVEGVAPPGVVFAEGVFRFGTRREAPPFGDTTPIATWLALWGTPYTDVPGTFRQRLVDGWQMRLAVHCRPHVAVPPHREVPAEEQRVKEERTQKPRGAVGVRIEEF